MHKFVRLGCFSVVTWVIAGACAHELQPDPSRQEAGQVAQTVLVSREAQQQARQHITAGRAQMQKGEQRQALQHFVDAGQLDPNLALAFLESAQARLALGDDEKLILADLKKARALAPHNPRVDFVCGLFHESFGRETQALSAYQKALSKRATFPRALFRAALLEEHQGQQQRALAHYQQAFALEPENSAAALGGARVATQLGELTQAEKLLRDLHRRFPQNTRFLQQLVEVLKASGKAADAARFEKKLAQRQGPERKLRPLLPSRH